MRLETQLCYHSSCKYTTGRAHQNSIYSKPFGSDFNSPSHALLYCHTSNIDSSSQQDKISTSSTPLLLPRYIKCPTLVDLVVTSQHLPDHTILLWPNNMQICCSAIDHPFLPLLTLMLLCRSPQPNSWVSLSKRPVTPLWGAPSFVSFSEPPLLYFTTKIRP
jgi:hypothetical protein